MGNLYPGRNPPAPASTAGGAHVLPAQDEDDSGPGPFVMSCASLAGDRVVNARGESLGRLEHLMLDVPSGRVAYAVLAHGGVLGIGEKLFAIPWDAFTLDAEHKRFVLDIDRDRLDKAPGFDRDHWPEMGDAAWATQIHDYYGLRPAGERAMRP